MMSCSILMRWPVKGAKATWKEYFQATWKQRWPGRRRVVR